MHDCPIPTSTRRQWLRECGLGFGGLALAGTMNQAGLMTQSARANPQIQAAHPLAMRPPHFAPKAKRVIHFFLNGGPSHVDTFDPKPMLQKYDGKPLPYKNLRTERKTGAALGSPFQFHRYGQSGIEVSEVFSGIAEHIDDIAVIRSMTAKVPNHEPSLLMMNCGESRLSRPSVGSWITYGLGTVNQNLPGFIVMCPGGYPIKDTENWQSSFLPGVFQGTHVDTKFTEIDRLIANVNNESISRSQQRRQLDLLREMNEQHREGRRENELLDARIESFELAYRMQIEAADAFDIQREPVAVRERYGEHVQGRQTLIARRLLERGVRYIQLWHGAGQPWDNHNNIHIHGTLGKQIDQPIAALMSDLKDRGMFEDTLILFGGEFGRTPTAEYIGGKLGTGRDHNPYGFSVWMAGGGIRGGTTYGATDDFGFQAEQNPVDAHDLHATMLHLLGFDHEKFTYRYAGRDFRLTDVAGRVIREIVA